MLTFEKGGKESEIWKNVWRNKMIVCFYCDLRDRLTKAEMRNRDTKKYSFFFKRGEYFYGL